MTPLKSVSLILLVLLTACRSAPPKVSVDLWAGDSGATFDRSHRGDLNTTYRGGITRAQVGESIACDDIRIEEYVCMTYADLKKLFDLIWMCERWPRGMQRMNNEEIEKTLKAYGIVATKAAEFK